MSARLLLFVWLLALCILFTLSHRVQAAEPIHNPQPPSTLLPPGATRLNLRVQSAEDTTCAYAMGADRPYTQMTVFDNGAGTQNHTTLMHGLNPDPNTVNEVYVRCAAQPEFVLHLRYRSLSIANPRFPRTGNLWGWGYFKHKDPDYSARIDLWLGDYFPPDVVRTLRTRNPHIRILTSINAVEESNLSEDYYLKDIHGQRVEVWPGFYRLNLTKLYVAEHQAHQAYQLMLESDLMVDGVFFDNVMTTQSWQTTDIYGKPFLIDANEDGVQDDPAQFDAAWKAGVFHEIKTFRQWMPHAVINGHSMDIYESGIDQLFNGISIGFGTANVIEGEQSFSTLWNTYHDWMRRALEPSAVMLEASPIDQFAYGYDYEPLSKIPPATLEFVRTFYPWMRFGLALTLMDDGYFAYEFGDTWHGNDWWYDELDFDLGYPLGAPTRIDLGSAPGSNQIVNGDFEQALAASWKLWANEESGAVAAVQRDRVEKKVGAASARIDIRAASGTDWHIEFSEHDHKLQQGLGYEVAFWAKADQPRQITLSTQQQKPPWTPYGLYQQVTLETEWRKYKLVFDATATVDDARLQFFLGAETGKVWLDDVQMTPHPPGIYRREFTNGLVLLNGTRQPQTVTVGSGWRRLLGQQAPRYETILDDSDTAFSSTGAWTTPTYDSGEWQANGPFYHNWGVSVHQSAAPDAEARWHLPITAADTYTITVWWPAAPNANSWNPQATYEVVADGEVVASQTVDQRRDGDQWHLVAEVALKPTDNAFVRIRCAGSAPCIADALYIRSHARYNDGTIASRVTLQPLDGILLRRIPSLGQAR